MARITRRKFLQDSASLLGAGLASAALPGSRTRRVSAQATPPTSPASLNDVQHVIIFMNENRSFDHYFGTLSGVRGFSDPNALKLSSGKPVFYQPAPQNPDGYILPFHLDSATTSAQCIPTGDHGWKASHKSLDNGSMDGWLSAESPLAMGYYTRADLPFHYALADAFTICDAYHSSVLGPTHPNRLYLWTATIDPLGKHGGPVTDNSVRGLTWTTYPERLEQAGVSWKIYQQLDNFDDNALAWFAQFESAPMSSPLYQKGLAVSPVSDFVNDIASGNLPQVSWIVTPALQSEHPPFPPAIGANYVRTCLEALGANPEVWKHTVFLYCYDEHDGFFDHVVPPLPPAGTPDEFLDGLPIGLGFRVPMIVISPFSRGGWVCSDVFDHTSILRFLEKRFGVMEPNISAWRRSVCGDLTSAFDFTSPDYSFPTLPDTTAALTAAGAACLSLPLPTVPQVQAMPTQEPGSRPRRGTAT